MKKQPDTEPEQTYNSNMSVDFTEEEMAEFVSKEKTSPGPQLKNSKWNPAHLLVKPEPEYLPKYTQKSPQNTTGPNPHQNRIPKKA